MACGATGGYVLGVTAGTSGVVGRVLGRIVGFAGCTGQSVLQSGAVEVTEQKRAAFRIFQGQSGVVRVRHLQTRHYRVLQGCGRTYGEEVMHLAALRDERRIGADIAQRSEEHTSELQSQR